MENLDCFLLLELPYVALKEVLSSWNPFEIINFSLVSRTTKRITKSIKKAKSHQTNLRLYISQCLSLSMYTRGVRYVYKMTSYKAQHGQQRIFVKYDTVKKTVRKFFEKGLKGFFEWCEFVMDVLNWRIDEIDFATGDFLENFENLKTIIEWLTKITKTTKLFIASGSKKSGLVDEMVSYFLNRITVTERLDLFVYLSENYQMIIPNISERLQVTSGKWLKMNQLLELDTSLITVIESEFSNQDIKLFINKWMLAESNSKLRYISMQVQSDTSFDEIFNSLEMETIRVDPDFPEEQAVIEIKRIDGRRATITGVKKPQGSFLRIAVKEK